MNGPATISNARGVAGHARIWPNRIYRIWPNKSEFGQFVFVTTFGQTEFGQNLCFKVLTALGQTAFGQFWCLILWPNFLLLLLSLFLLLFVPGCCCLLLLLFFLVVVVVVVVVLGCCLLLLVVACCCFCCWCVCVLGVFKILGPLPHRTALSPGPPDPGRRGFHTTTRELQTCTVEPRRFKNTTKIPRENPPERRRKNKKLWREREKEAPNFGHSTLRGPTPSGPTFFWVGPPPLRALTPSAPPPLLGPHPSGPSPKTKNWPNAVWPISVHKNWPNTAKIRMAKRGQLTLGQMRPKQVWPNAAATRVAPLSHFAYHPWPPAPKSLIDHTPTPKGDRTLDSHMPNPMSTERSEVRPVTANLATEHHKDLASLPGPTRLTSSGLTPQ